MNTACEADDTNPELLDVVRKEIERWKAEITQILQAGIKDSEFRKDTSIPRVALTIIALIEGSVLLGRTSADRKDRDLVLDSIKEIIDNIQTRPE